MKILWFTWKDIKHPMAGGAEIVAHELAKRLVKDGHELIFLTSGFKNSSSFSNIEGYKSIRVGNKWTVYLKAFIYYKKYLKDWPDIIIDEYQAIPFFTKYYVKQKSILMFHQLARNVWFYQMFFPLSLIGYILEPIYLRLINNQRVITISNSTKADLISFGFKQNKISIISEGIEIEPIHSLKLINKFPTPTILSLGSIRPMKRTGEIINSFEILKKTLPDLQLIIAGKACGQYGKKILKKISKSEYNSSIKYYGHVSKEEKIDLLKNSHVLVVTSVREGWGLIVTEANSQGTPAVVYNVEGLRDAVKNNETGLVCELNSPNNLAKNIKLILNDKQLYERLQNNAWQWSKTINFTNSYKEFIESLNEK